MVEIIVHRVAHTIGESCVEVRYTDDCLALNLGMPLMGRDGAELDQDALIKPEIDDGVLCES